MTVISTNQFKSGLKIMLGEDPCHILEHEFFKPGKGQAYSRVRYRNLRSGRVLDKTFKSGENVELADVVEVEMQYLYQDGELWHFMDPTSFEQYTAEATAMAEAAPWLKGGENCAVLLWDNAPLSVQAPNFVLLTITETDPGVRGDTATGGSKPATVETGAIIKVPLFVESGELIKIDTRIGEYISRAKE